MDRLLHKSDFLLILLCDLNVVIYEERNIPEQRRTI